MKYLSIIIVVFGFLITTHAQDSKNETPLQKYEADVRANPNSAEAWFRLGEYHRKGIIRSKALEAYQKAIELKPDYAEAYNGIGLYIQAPDSCGHTYLSMSKEETRMRYESAIEFHKSAIILKPDYTEAYIALGIAYNRLDRNEEAVTAYEQAVKLDSGDTNVYLFLAETYEKLERFEKALDFYQRTTNQSKNYQNLKVNSPAFYRDKTNLYLAFHRIAKLFRKLNRHNDALDTYKQIMRSGIDSADTHFGLGLTYINLNDKKLARVEYETLLKLSKTEDTVVMQELTKKQAAELLEQIKNQ